MKANESNYNIYTKWLSGCLILQTFKNILMISNVQKKKKKQIRTSWKHLEEQICIQKNNIRLINWCLKCFLKYLHVKNYLVEINDLVLSNEKCIYSMRKLKEQREVVKKKCFTIHISFWNHKGVWMMTGCGNVQQENGFEAERGGWRYNFVLYDMRLTLNYAHDDVKCAGQDRI